MGFGIIPYIVLRNIHFLASVVWMKGRAGRAVAKPPNHSDSDPNGTYLRNFGCAGTGLQPVPERFVRSIVKRKRCGRGCKPRPAHLSKRH